MAGTRGGSIALARIRQILCELVSHEIEVEAIDPSTEKVPREFAVEFVVGAYLAVLTRWLERGARRSPEQMDRFSRRLVMQGPGLGVDQKQLARFGPALRRAASIAQCVILRCRSDSLPTFLA